MKRSKTIQLCAALAAVGILAVAVPAAAQQEASTPTVFHACYVPGTGTVYRIKEANLPGQCARRHVEFSWGESTRTGPEVSAAPTAGGGKSGGGPAVQVGAAAGGDLGGTYPNPSVTRIQGQAVSAGAPTAGQVLTWDGSAWTARPVPGGAGVTAHGQLSGLENDDHPHYLRADGTRALSGSLAAGGFKITGLGAASAAGEAVRFEQAVKSGDAAGGDLSGSFPSPTVSKLLGRSLSATAPTDGQVLRWNAASSTWEPASASSGGVTAHSQLLGLGNDDHGHYLLANGNRTAFQGFAVTGQLGLGGTVVSGPGIRMLWYPAKASFRAGGVDGAQWDMGNTADYTTAFGFNSMATATYATAFGQSVTAGGAGAVAGGRRTRASGTAAVALGDETVADGWAATALGKRTLAGGTSALAAGDESSAFGTAAMALGKNVRANGDASTALGHSTRASGLSAIAIGHFSEATGDYSTAIGSYANTNGQLGSFVYGDGSNTTSNVNATAPNQFVVRASGGFVFYTNPTMSAGVSLPSGAGAWSTLSDVNRKENFRSVDGDAVLEKLAEMAIREWNYTSQDASIRHVGPTAQDFHAAFGLGESETTISTVDADGISLLGLQSLTRRLARQQEEIASLQATVALLEERFARLEAGLERAGRR